MSHQILLDRIKADADAEVAAIAERANETVAAIQRETDANIAAMQAEQDAATKKQLERQALVAQSRAKQEANLALQTAKREQIDSLITQLREWLQGFSGDAYVAFYKKRYEALVSGAVTVSVVQAPKDKADDTATLLQALGITAPVTPVTTITGGVLLTTSDGVYDLTLERLLDDERAALELAIINEILA